MMYKDVVINNPLAIPGCILRGEAGVGDAIARGDLDIKGDWSEFLEKNSLGSLLPYKRNSIDKTKIPYSISPEVYEILLGPSMSYTCAVFDGLTDSLLKAQSLKYWLHSKWLELGEHDKPLSHLDCGCGWGGYTRFVNQNYNTLVDAISISEHQIDYCKGFKRKGGTGFMAVDWRYFDPAPYDRFTAQGMLEHVGKENLAEFFLWVNSVLVSGGIGTLQFISRDKPMSEWFDKRIFPGAYPPNFNEVCRYMKQAGLTITDSIVRHEDYVLTLKAWLHNLESNTGKIKALGLDDKFIRMFKLYLSGGIASFRSGNSQLIQLRFVKG